ncbi:MAG: AAA family ATPase, partial [Planctomycetota bacterium]
MAIRRPPHHTLWRMDLGAVPAVDRRPARFALQLILGDSSLRSRLHDRDFLGSLWQLTLPLLNPQAVQTFLNISNEDFEEEDELAEMVDGSNAEELVANRGHRRLLIQFFETLPRSHLTRLIKADGEVPVASTVSLLGQSLGLDATDMRVLDFLEQHTASKPLRTLLRECQQAHARTNLPRLAVALGLDEPALRAALARRAPLRSLGLLEYNGDESDLEDFLRPATLLHEVLNAAPADADSLLATLIQPAPAGVWRLADFPHLTKETARLREVLSQAAATGAVGVNALFYGPPGTGKTELARALAEACGLKIFQVRSADEDGDGLAREGRLSAYLLAQRLLERRRDTLLIFDEVEDVFNSGHDLLAALFGGRRRQSVRQKGWMNRILEENRVPAVWITNSTEGMDPAFLRRFLLPVSFVTPPRSVRRQMAERHLGGCQLPPALLDELAADSALTPAQLGTARRLLDLQPSAPAEQTVREGVAAVRVLLHGQPSPQLPKPATEFDVAFLNLSGGIAPAAIAQALDRQGRGSLCFYGPPGTGKTLFAQVLAEALDRELIARQASDLISPYVGETEQNLARLFRECDTTHTVLMLDEIDSFLSDRRQAQRSWERTQVNELLQ